MRNLPISLSALPLHGDLSTGSRLRPLGGSEEVAKAREWLALIGAGAAAALSSTLVRARLGIPGHHILYAVLPMALGFALVPRRGAGSVMGGSALATIAGLGLAGVRLPGVGALTSLLLTGPLLDVALRWGRNGWRLYLAFTLTGCAANTAAFAVRAAAKLLQAPGLAGARPAAAWLSLAPLTYAAAGLVAGLVSAAAWFRLRSRDR